MLAADVTVTGRIQSLSGHTLGAEAFLPGYLDMDWLESKIGHSSGLETKVHQCGAQILFGPLSGVLLPLLYCQCDVTKTRGRLGLSTNGLQRSKQMSWIVFRTLPRTIAYSSIQLVIASLHRKQRRLDAKLLEFIKAVRFRHINNLDLNHSIIV